MTVRIEGVRAPRTAHFLEEDSLAVEISNLHDGPVRILEVACEFRRDGGGTERFSRSLGAELPARRREPFPVGVKYGLVLRGYTNHFRVYAVYEDLAQKRTVHFRSPEPSVNLVPNRADCSLSFFISYKMGDGGDGEMAEKVRTCLSKVGFAGVRADDILSSGQHPHSRIRERIDESSGMILLWTKSAAGSKHIMNEVEYARARGKALLPIVERGAEVPGWLSKIQYSEIGPADPDLDIARFVEGIDERHRSLEFDPG